MTKFSLPILATSLLFACETDVGFMADYNDTPSDTSVEDEDSADTQSDTSDTSDTSEGDTDLEEVDTDIEPPLPTATGGVSFANTSSQDHACDFDATWTFFDFIDIGLDTGTYAGDCEECDYQWTVTATIDSIAVDDSCDWIYHYPETLFYPPDTGLITVGMDSTQNFYLGVAPSYTNSFDDITYYNAILLGHIPDDPSGWTSWSVLTASSYVSNDTYDPFRPMAEVTGSRWEFGTTETSTYWSVDYLSWIDSPYLPSP